MNQNCALTPEEQATYEWQMWVEDFGEAGQEALKGATALVSRVGGLGGPLAYALTAAGVGRLILAHGGCTKPSDLNRQITTTHDNLGKPRVTCSARRLQELNPRLEVVPVDANIGEENAAELVAQADIVFGAAPLFQERFLLNRECVRQRTPLVDAAMFDMEGTLLTVLPGQTACLACLYPDFPDAWRREFPVFGAVSAVVANLAAVEGFKILAGFGDTLAGRLLHYDTRRMTFRTVAVPRRADCAVCGGAS